MAQATASAYAPRHAQGAPAWSLSTNQFDRNFEAEPFVGNGILGLRIPAAGMGYVGNLGRIGWPLGTERIASAIVAGVYAKVADGSFYKEPKEAIALIPNWSTLEFGDESGMYAAATATAAQISGYHQVLDLRTGTVITSGIWTSPGGHKMRFRYRVATNRARGHRAIVELELMPMWTGRVMVASVLDGAGARRLDLVSQGADVATHSTYSTYKSKGTNIVVSESGTLESNCELTESNAGNRNEVTAEEVLSYDGRAGKSCKFIKYVGVVTGRESATPESDARAESLHAAKEGIEAFEKENRAAWDQVWNAGIEVEGDASLQRAIRANQYALFASIADGSPMSLGPSGLSSDGYAGMVFWDADTWMFPALLAQHPELARVMVNYRSDTLPAAEKNANDNGYKGALYPWTSGLTGDMGDECYGAVTNAAGKVIADPNKSCTQQLHLQSDVGLAQWQYYEATGDKTWLASRGWPVLEAVARFWESKVTPTADGYAIDNVQTPDEYATDIDNDAYTNADASLELKAATEAARVLGKPAPEAWAKISAGLIKTMQIDRADNIYVEHQGYTGQKIKQADVVMLTYPLDFSMPKSMAIDDLNYYTPRTDVDGPAMTDAIHSIAAAAVGAPGCSAYTYLVRSYQPFMRAPFDQFSEFAPVDLTATAYDFLTGVGGFMQEFLYGFSGYRPLVDAVRLDPNLPPQLKGITLRDMAWQGRLFTMNIGPDSTTVTLSSGAALPVETPTGTRQVKMGAPLFLATRRADLQPTDNLARCQTVTATSAAPGSPAVAAVDGIPATAWVAAEAKAALTVKLAKAIGVARVHVMRGSREPFPYTVETSMDGVHWKAVAHAPAIVAGDGAGSDDLSFAPVKALFVRVAFEGGQDAKPPVIDELAVMAAMP